MLKGSSHTMASRAKLSAAKMGIPGHLQTPQAREKIAAAKWGVRRPDLVGNRTAWKGGRTLETQGYVRIYSPSHPRCDRRGYVLEHRLVMEAHLGRTLLPTEVVHHINGIKDDNRIENLERFDANADHMRRGIHQENTNA
jgi:hypothetical protein